MRLHRLHLAPYGKFRDRVLDFGAGAGRKADVTLVYGPNEAGKSTLFAAWLDLLFGMAPRNMGYDFRYPRSELRIGAEIETGEGPLTLWRTGKRKDALTDSDGRPVPEHRLAALLHGLDRESYSRRFSLNDEILRKGGDEILAAKGDLGQTLYAGASGLSGLSAALEDIEASIDAVHKKGGRATLVAEKKRELEEIDALIRTNRLDPRRHDALGEALVAASARRDAAQGALERAEAACTLHRAAEKRAELRRDRAEIATQLAAYPDGPDLPAGAEARFAALHEILRNGRRALQEARDAIREAEDKSTAETPDPDGLALAGTIVAIEALTFGEEESLVERARSSALDLHKREAELERITARCVEMAGVIGGTGADPDALALPPATVERVAKALSHLREAGTEVQNAAREVNRARKAVGEPVAPPTGMAVLEMARRAWQDATRADPAALTEEATRAGAEAARLAATLPDDWSARSRASQGLPDDAALAALVERLEEGERRGREAEAALAEAQGALEEAEAEKAACAARDDHISDSGLAAHRRARDAAWAAHRAALSPDTADAFERALHADDDARTAHLGGVELRERVRNLGEAVHRATKARDRRRVALDSAQAAIGAMRGEAAPVLAALGLPPDAPATALRPRRAALAGALDAALTAEEARRRADEARARLDQATAALRGMLATPPADEAGLAEAVDSHLAALRQQEKAHDAWRKATDHALAREGELGDAQSVLDARRAELADGVHGLWCAGETPEALEQQMPLLRDLAREIEMRDDLHRRVTLMRDAREAFEAEAAPLRALLGSEAPPAILMDEARARAQTAREIDTRLATARAALDKARAAETRAARLITEAEADRAALLTGQTMPAGEAVEDFAARLLARDALRGQGAALDAQSARWAEGLDAQALVAAENALAPGRGAVLDAEREEARRAHAEAIGAEALAREALMQAESGSGGAEADQRRALILAELREAVGDAAARMVGLRAAHATLDRLRQTRRGPMLERSQTAFTRMTGTAWTGLETRPEGTGERLVALRGEEIVSAEGMSQGTRGQLYLSLRLAGHALFCEEAGPLPFVTDDVLETFDDARAAAALDLTMQLGQRGQAILLTHHRHLVEMAEERIPDLRVIEL